MSEAILRPEPLVVAQGIAKSYPGIQALAPVSFTIQEGERVALAGASGSGKTTLLYLLAGLLQPGEGWLTIDREPLSRLKPGKKLSQLVGLIHQQYDLVPHLPVMHNVLAGRLGQWSFFRSVASLAWPQERHLAQKALSQVGIAHKLYERTSHLSGGEQQRVAIARLVVQSPRLVLADEPVSSLDPARGEEALRLLTGLADVGGQTLVVSLHSPYFIKKYFSRVIGLRQSQLYFDLPTEELTGETLDQLYQVDHHSPQGAATEVS